MARGGGHDMSQPARWLWGLIPLALLWAAGNLTRDAAIERDIRERAVRAVAAAGGAAPGARPVVAWADGRDVTVSGEVLSADGAGKAMAQLRGEFGIRRALGGLSQVVAQKPYSWFAARAPGAVTLGGFTPDLATAAANAAMAGAGLPGLRIDDRQTVAFGAPDGYAAMTAAMLAQLPKLASGRVALDDGRFCIEGTAESVDAFLALQSAMRELARPGFQGVNCDLDPPTVAPYRWSAEREEAGAVLLRGSFPREAEHAHLLATIRRIFPAGTAIRDEMTPGLGAPSAFNEKVTRAAADLARLSHGKVELRDDVYTLSGKGPDSYDACQALRLQIAQGDGPDSVAQVAIECPPRPMSVEVPLPDVPGLILHDVLPAPSAGPAPGSVPPPAADRVAADRAAPLDWRAKREATGIVIDGAVPDEAIRAAIVASARRLFGQATVEDRMKVGPVLPSGLDLPAAAAFALEALSRLASGSVAIRGQDFAIAGEAANSAGMAALRTWLAKGGPAGLALPGSVADNVTARIYGLSLSIDRGGLQVSGDMPDEAARAALVARLADTPFKDRLDDRTQLSPGAPDGFREAMEAVVADLLRLDLGSASIQEDRVVIRGLTCRELVKREIETHAESGLPRGFKGDAVIALRETGCTLAPPASCQNELDGLTRRDAIPFGQGTTALGSDSATERLIAEAATILGKCAGSAVTIEGHANTDGDRRGFDNIELSLRRALKVREALEQRGIEPGRLTVKAYGSTRPLVRYDAPEARATNRRVQFTVTK